LTFVETLPNDIGEYSFFADNFYGSLALVLSLLSIGLRSTVTVRKDRPTWLWTHLHKQISRGFAACINTLLGISAISWKDKGKKPTNLLSSEITDTWVSAFRRVGFFFFKLKILGGKKNCKNSNLYSKSSPSLYRGNGICGSI
jgi:hypothetical protein